MNDITKPGSPPAAKNTKIASLAAKLSRAREGDPTDVWGDQLFTLLGRYLTAGRDDILYTAQQEAFAKGGGAAFAQITNLLEVMSTTQESPDSRGMVLFAIPVVLFVDETFRERGDLGELTPLDNVERSFVRFGLAGEEAVFRLVPYLFDTNELDMLDFSEVRLLSRDVLCGMIENEMAAAKPDECWPNFTSDLRLTYLVGGYLDDAGVMPFSLPADADESQLNALYTRITEWSEAMDAELETLVGPGCRQVITGTPAPFHEALRRGDILYREVDFESTTHAFLANSELTPDQVLAVVRPHGEGDELAELRVSYARADNAEFVGGAVFNSLGGDLQKTRESLQQLLASFPFARINFSDETLPMETCECCGEPVFFSPDSVEAPDPAWTGHTLH